MGPVSNPLGSSQEFVDLTSRWYLYDNTTDLIFKKRLGFVTKGEDVDGVLAAFRNTGWVIGLMALFPYLLNPLFQLPVLGQYLLPRSSNSTGVGKVMKVMYRSLIRDDVTNDFRSTGIVSHTNLSQRRNPLYSSRRTHLDPISIVLTFSSLQRLQHSQTTHPNDISNEDVSAETLMLMVAAPDTTSALICATIDNIVSNPSMYAKVMHEICTFTSQGHLNIPIASFAQIKSMPYFTSCVFESARFFPSIPVVLPRRVSPPGIILNGKFIPEGTSIGASPSVINRDPGVFGPDAHVFRPERWLGPQDQVKQMHRFLFTWGFGSRKCVGKNLALIETYKLCLQVCHS